MRFRRDPAAIRGSIAPVVSPFTAGGEPDLDETLELTAAAAGAGADAVLIITPYYARPTQGRGEGNHQEFEHFSRVLQVAGRDTLVWSGIELLCLPLLSLTGAGQQTVLRLLKAGAPVLDGPVATVAG